jgi:hypothetical protein
VQSTDRENCHIAATPINGTRQNALELITTSGGLLLTVVIVTSRKDGSFYPADFE